MGRKLEGQFAEGQHAHRDRGQRRASVGEGQAGQEGQ
jgi:hypothetical protein